MTPEQREQAENYAKAIGHTNVEEMTDERLERIMQSIADDCAKYGCD